MSNLEDWNFEDTEMREDSEDTNIDIPFLEIEKSEEDKVANHMAEIKGSLPILPLRNMVLFPTAVLPVGIGRPSSFAVVKNATEDMKNDGLIAVFCQKDPEVDEPGYEDLYKYGVVAKVVKIFEMPNNKTTAVIQGMQRIKLLSTEKTGKILYGNVENAPERVPNPKDEEFAVLMNNCREKAFKLMSLHDGNQGHDTEFAFKSINNNMLLLYFICANINLSIKEKMQLMRITSIKEKGYQLLSMLDVEMKLLKIQEKIHKRTSKELNQQQKEYFLQQQLKNIQEELGVNTPEQDSTELKNKAKNKKWSKEVEEIFNKEVAKLDRIPPQTPDYHVQLNYLQMFVSLPWGNCTTDNLDIDNARKTLDKDHYGLDKVKERILEHLAVIKMRGDLKSPIICLYGPPGVGKTSLGKSIAEALKRKYVRMSLGGVHDESEIRGHR
ncbi:MAG: LON peptidase substrate-binding domain-containing protein, partial [Bacteroidaceae bacterium]|nr:LON peptidase substrate-binding domain-containing protein [Bacteroidaceae bacterium]